ncbi:MAG TPA: caspase family protein [Thermoanaerobaculia bacterium]|jgi:V8-like Glu-specific endopeptidase|nr:caspase family protein [Thermoanaerobaculia bacterium]
MRAHALVIGIDRYPKPAWNLTGAVKDALEFADWVVKAGGVAPENLTLLLSPVGDVPGAKRATRKAINDAFQKYQNGAAKDADRFWFYYAGHGLAAPGQDTAAGPLVVPADTKDINYYVDQEPVGLELFRGRMQDVLPKQQFFFVDACRDVLPPTSNKSLVQQLSWDVRKIDDDQLSTQAVFLGTTAGQKSKEVRGKGLFGRALLNALRGLGPRLRAPAAPPPPGETMRRRLVFTDLVTFVREEVERSLAAMTDLDEAGRKGIPYSRLNRITEEISVAEFDDGTLPKMKVYALVDPPAARESAKIEFLKWDEEEGWVARKDPAPAGPKLAKEVPFQIGGGKYWVRVRAKGFREDQREILTYDGKRYVFELLKTSVADDLGLEAFAEAAPVPTTGKLVVTCQDPKARVAIADGSGKELARAYQKVELGDLAPGPYRISAELTRAERTEENIVLRAGETIEKALSFAAPPSGRMEKILHDHDIAVDNNFAKLPADLGDVANVRLGSLLAYGAWAARWPKQESFEPLRAIGVDPLKGLKASQSAVQVLIGDVGESGDSLLDGCRVTLEGVKEPLPLQALPKLPAVQASAVHASGSLRVRVVMPGFAPASFALTLLPRFVTALVITREADDDIDVQQHLNPVDVTKPVGKGFDLPMPDDVRLVELAWRALEGRDPLDDIEFGGLLAGKRSNPMLAVIAGYRMFRTKRENEFRKTALKNMLRLFPKLPDVHVLAGMYEPEERDKHFQRAMDIGTPALAEGLWTLVEWLGTKSVADKKPTPILQENVLPGMVWTAFTERTRTTRTSDVRVVSKSGRSSTGDSADSAVFAKAAHSVGRLEHVGGDPLSSTFLVAPDLVLCPIHVVTQFAKEKTDGTWTLKKKMRVRFDLANAAYDREIKSILRTLRPDDPNPDGGSLDAQMLEICWPVLLQLKKKVNLPPLTFGRASAAGQRVAVIGFPFDYSIPSKTFAQQFAGASGERNVMPGTVRRAPGKTWTLDYDCFTAAGTSGAPVVNAQNGRVVGMHVAGKASDEGFKVGVGIEMSRLAKLL